ncbi:LysR family transcriptional regulator [Clostridium sp. 2-1]|uniref:LysR family transcriptional regulator n=1 Tax=Candidatus Clostridium helianthi TaxID=3381660 RepID=A0ABW8S893_9CLOT|nr:MULTISPECIES: LysR family transcriptional regulator [Clostridium]MBN7573366.1 LysR family transcriptional regulator [Clostridium beijerinckii]MBN7578704.1 LysR family transcriptional regulator [Clostridium beijerinckii]MBN7583139.1 LysR family transcriptional regulator [Clostridium beijerinckii]MBO0519294.1 LysR family transcriptional regulator [Clostridium beijerinckii]POO92313.1 LysR family transcriptional regulator [Clostridium sp. 2-1]
MHINLELYRIFYITAQLGSISKAAKELFTSQPAVSQSIKLLEEKLGGQLFYRTPRGVSLTLEGEVLFKYIEQGYGLMQTAERKFLELKNLTLGQIRIAACSTTCKYYLMKYLEEYSINFPNIKIYIKDQPTYKIVRALEAGEVDIGILNMNIENTDSLNINKVFKLQDCFVVGEKYKTVSEKEISLKEMLDGYPIILPEKGSDRRDSIDNYISSYGLKVFPQIQLSSMDLLIEFAKKGLGVSCVVEDYIQKELEEKQLYKVSIKEKIPERVLGIATHKNIPISTATEEFIKLIKV